MRISQVLTAGRRPDVFHEWSPSGRGPESREDRTGLPRRTDVNPNLDQIVVTFDSPMKTASHSLVVLGDLTFPELAGG